MKKSWRRNVKCMVFAAGLALTLSCTAYADETTFVPGTSVNGLGISNMTVDQATQRIADFYASDYKLTIKEKGGKTEVITGPEIGYSVGLPEGYLQQILDQQNSSGRLSGPDVDNKHRSDMTGSFDSAALDFDLHRVCFDDPDGVLNQTEYTQPCMVAFACGVTAVLAEHGVKPDYVAGLSLGEYSALEAAGVFTARQAIELAAYRGQAMADAAKGIDCGMTAVLGLDRAALAACCEQAADLGCVQICNYNCPGQLVIGGEKAAVEKAAELAKAAGARRCIPLKVSGPFHTRLMAPAGDALAKRFETELFGTMKVPVLFNCLGREKADADSIPALLVKQVQSSVYMEDTLRRLGELGVDHILEVGPGSALSGFVKKTLPGVPCASVETPEQLDAALAAWRDEA